MSNKRDAVAAVELLRRIVAQFDDERTAKSWHLQNIIRQAREMVAKTDQSKAVRLAWTRLSDGAYTADVCRNQYVVRRASAYMWEWAARTLEATQCGGQTTTVASAKQACTDHAVATARKP